MVIDWSPEPPRESDEVSFNNSNIVPFGISSSDSDEDNTVHPEGYEPLTDLPIDGSDDEATDNESEFGDSVHDEQEILQFDEAVGECSSQSPARESLSQLWAGPARDIVLEEDGADAIRSAMEGFVLPPGAFPAWASAIPEEQWTDILRQRIANIQHN